ncbi:MAG: response regulator transcription factor [Actinomycetota bacterium]
MKLKVLVIEDDATVRDVLTTLLAFDDVAVAAAADGFTGLELSETMQPDIVLLDVGLPGIDGLEVCRMVRKRVPGTRVVMVTGRGTAEDELNGVAAGADAYLRKPFSPLELLEALGMGEDGSVLS